LIPTKAPEAEGTQPSGGVNPGQDMKEGVVHGREGGEFYTVENGNHHQKNSRRDSKQGEGTVEQKKKVEGQGNGVE